MKWGLVKRRNDIENYERPFWGDIDKFFDDFFDLASPKVFESDWYPRVDIEEDEKTYRLKAEMPGLDEKDISVTLEKNVLTISGEKNEDHEEKKENKRVLRERRYGSFSRSWKLPEGVKGDEVKAEFKKGVLTIELPKDEAAQPRKIDVEVH